MNDHEFRNIIESVRERIDIVQVIGQYIDLDRHNRGLCPFHQEKTPSFSVNVKKQYFHCFGCGTAGDAFRFLELFEEKSFMMVLDELATQTGISLTSLTSEDRQHIDQVRTTEDILTEAARFYHRCLTPEVRNFLTSERGFNDETIALLQVGYANGKLRKHLLSRCNFSLDLCLKSGVLKKTDKGIVRDYFYNRIIFPNLKRGKVVHISGRSTNGQEPKYLHLPGRIHYLYNEDSLSSKEVLITEGIPDCLSALQAGFSSVAVLGTQNFKPEYLQKFSRCEQIYLCMDGDIAGEEGALRIGKLIGERAKIVSLPEGLDLNDYLKDHPKEDFDSLIDCAKDVISYELNLIPQDADKTTLPQRLESVLKQLARMEKSEAEAYLTYKIKPRYNLKSRDIDGYREIINKHRKAEIKASNDKSPQSDSKPVYAALFDGLVDLVEQDGHPAFLMKEEYKLSILTEVVRDGIRYVPPPKDQIPWLLPRGKEVLAYFESGKGQSVSEQDSALYNDLLAYHRAISEFPGEEYYDLIVAWVLHTYLLESVQYSLYHSPCLTVAPL